MNILNKFYLFDSHLYVIREPANKWTFFHFQHLHKCSPSILNEFSFYILIIGMPGFDVSTAQVPQKTEQTKKKKKEHNRTHSLTYSTLLTQTI